MFILCLSLLFVYKYIYIYTYTVCIVYHYYNDIVIMYRFKNEKHSPCFPRFIGSKKAPGPTGSDCDSASRGSGGVRLQGGFIIPMKTIVR